MLLRPWLAVIVALSLIFGGVGAIACDDDEEEGTTIEDVEDAGDLGDDATDDGADDADTPAAGGDQGLIGQTVTVDGEVIEVVNDQAFIIGGDTGFFEEQSEVLVVSATGLDLSEDDQVSVTGTVERWVVAEVEDEFGIDFDDGFEVEYDAESYISATSVTPDPDAADDAEQDPGGDPDAAEDDDTDTPVE